MGELRENTRQREIELKKMGLYFLLNYCILNENLGVDVLHTIWECEFTAMKKRDRALNDFCRKLRIVGYLEPRKAFKVKCNIFIQFKYSKFTGRPHTAIQVALDTRKTSSLSGRDIVGFSNYSFSEKPYLLLSLYPFINYTSKYPLGNPRIHNYQATIEPLPAETVKVKFNFQNLTFKKQIHFNIDRNG